jgi:hypothetical protein
VILGDSQFPEKTSFRWVYRAFVAPVGSLLILIISEDKDDVGFTRRVGEAGHKRRA